MARWIARGVLVFPCLNSLSGFLIWDIKVWIDNRSWQPASSVCLADLPSTHTHTQPFNLLFFCFLRPRPGAPDVLEIIPPSRSHLFKSASPGCHWDVMYDLATPFPPQSWFLICSPRRRARRGHAGSAAQVSRTDVTSRASRVDGFLLTLRPLQRSHEVRVLSLSFALSQFSVFNEVYWHNYRSAVLPKRSYKEWFQKQP